MKIYKVGPDDLPEYEMNWDSSQFKWFVYWYEGDGYDGSGQAVALGKDGLLYYTNLGHCSCYGPMDGWMCGGMPSSVTVEEYLREKDNVHDYEYKEVVNNQVRTLLGV